MTIGEVVGTVVSTHKDEKLVGAKLLMVQPLTLDWKPKGEPMMAIDMLDAGAGDRVLLVHEGRAAQLLLGKDLSPVDCAVVGIIDQVDLHEGR